MRAERPERPALLAGAAILIGSALIALSLVFIFRWSVIPTSNIIGAFRLDRWSGDLAWCSFVPGQGSNKLDCTAK